MSQTPLQKSKSPGTPGLTLKQNLKGSIHGAPAIVGKNEKLNQMLSIADRVAPTNASILILGESGTGKELIARRIHAKSQRSNENFVAINCGALTESLLESELFGHEKGAFTGAVSTKPGLVETAEGGTLFLDEIGEMPLSLQAKMLRFLQEGEIYRVGGKEPIHVNVRILSATNRDLENEVQAGKFREDLFYRLNTISIRSPSLRERKDDLGDLMEHFSPGILADLTPEALECLIRYNWPGNIRELQNTVERMRVLAGEGKISELELPAAIRSPNSARKDLKSNDFPPPTMPLEELEKLHILRCLEHFEGNKTRAAQSLGITIKTLYNKLHRYGILDKSEVNL
jgi:transcriptional regulator with PAS, ATPase and Fis domain